VAEIETSDVIVRVGEIVSCCDGDCEALIVSLFVSVLEFDRETSDENDIEVDLEGERESEMSFDNVGVAVFVLSRVIVREFDMSEVSVPVPVPVPVAEISLDTEKELDGVGVSVMLCVTVKLLDTVSL
jgi:hypothetical protein